MEWGGEGRRDEEERDMKDGMGKEGMGKERGCGRGRMEQGRKKLSGLRN